MMPRSRECHRVNVRSGIIVESRLFSLLRKFSESTFPDLHAGGHAHSTSILRIFSFMVGFFKVDCLNLALCRRRRPALGPDLDFFFSLLIPGNGHRSWRQSETTSSRCDMRLTLSSSCGRSGTITAAATVSASNSRRCGSCLNLR
jgi:hypothetical protein